MKNSKRLLSFLCFMLVTSSYAHAQTSMNSARIAANDVPALAEFYKSTFGMYEVQRIELGGGNIEVMLNFGNTQEEALNNPAPQVVIMHSDTPVLDDPIAHLIFNVTEVDNTVADIRANGGEIEVGPFEYGDTGIIIVMGLDPQGNRFELLRIPPAG